MTTTSHLHAGPRAVRGRRVSAPVPTLPYGCEIDVERRNMLNSWYEQDLAAWEKRTGRRVTIRVETEANRITWRVDGARIASTDLSDVVYGRLDLETAIGASRDKNN